MSEPTVSREEFPDGKPHLREFTSCLRHRQPLDSGPGSGGFVPFGRAGPGLAHRLPQPFAHSSPDSSYRPGAYDAARPSMVLLRPGGCGCLPPLVTIPLDIGFSPTLLDLVLDSLSDEHEIPVQEEVLLLWKKTPCGGTT